MVLVLVLVLSRLVLMLSRLVLMLSRLVFGLGLCMLTLALTSSSSSIDGKCWANSVRSKL